MIPARKTPTEVLRMSIQLIEYALPISSSSSS